MKILLIRTWKQNIGNAVIEKGTRSLIKEAFPKSEVIEVSAYPNYISSRIQSTSGFISSAETEIKSMVSNSDLLSKLLTPVHDLLVKKSQSPTGAQTPTNPDIPTWITNWEEGNTDLSNIASLIDFDLAVLPGCVLGGGLAVCKPILRDLQKRNIPIFLVGVGGADYDKGTTDYVRDYLDDIVPAGIITRDPEAYRKYHDIAPEAYSGIDCGLFINDWHSPPSANKTFIATCFDKIQAPEINTQTTVLRTNHGPFRNPGIGFSNRISALFKSNFYEPIKEDFLSSENAIISDCLEDYLFVYSNTEVTYSDRIHACIPTISYGNEAAFYFETPRAKLFENLHDRGVVSKSESGSIMVPNERKLEEEKNKQVGEFSRMVSEDVSI
ncbi:polysaccharide pyruvyl transferase family protein [Halobiforma nitratireducens]|uniref:polysaccharide pyruvyl transferase family protein n=1 Tax=Halobiforma nitratireducens TaxID=130048 RepID=UPI0012680095|nr:polysaccharide pyruvyl transferase family protein [Halobiforma nitratireducens]